MRNYALVLCLTGLATLGGSALNEAKAGGPVGSPFGVGRGRVVVGGGFGIGVGGCRPCFPRPCFPVGGGFPGGGCFPVGGCFPRRPFPCGPFPGGCFPGPKFPRVLR